MISLPTLFVVGAGASAGPPLVASPYGSSASGRAGVLGVSANNLIGNHRQSLSTELSTDRTLRRLPRERHRVLPSLVVRERYFREAKCREENHGTSRRDGGPDAIDDTRQQCLPAVQCTFAAPDWSEHVNERRVRHAWSCDSCGYAFETTVIFPSGK